MKFTLSLTAGRDSAGDPDGNITEAGPDMAGAFKRFRRQALAAAAGTRQPAKFARKFVRP